MDCRLNDPEFRAWLKMHGIDADTCMIDMLDRELDELWAEFQDG